MPRMRSLHISLGRIRWLRGAAWVPVREWAQHICVLTACVLGIAGGTGVARGQCELEKLIADDGVNGDRFSSFVAISGDVALIGAPTVTIDHVGHSMGAVYVLRREGSAWVQAPRLGAADATTGDYGAVFGHRVAIDGDTAVIGAPGDYLGGIYEGPKIGAVYVFQFDGVNWVQQQKLLPDDGEHNDSFGSGLAIDGSTIVIGSPFDDDHGSGAGSAYVFHFDGNRWVQQQKLFGSIGGGASYSRFGFSVSLDGETLAIGAPGDDVGGLDEGAAYVFRFDGSIWNQEQLLLPEDDDGAMHDYFGQGVSVDADTMLIGAQGDDDNGDHSGSAFVFRFDSHTSHWFQEQKLLASHGAADDTFGSAVALVGNTALIGAYGTDDYIGGAHVFRRDGSTWVETHTLRPSDFDVPDPLGAPPFFGLRLAMDGDTAVIGAPHDDNENGGDAGAAYMFVGMSGIDCNDNQSSDACDILDGSSDDGDGNGIPDECE